MFAAVGIDPEHGDQHQVVADVQAVDLDHQQVQLRQVLDLRALYSRELPPRQRSSLIPRLAGRGAGCAPGPIAGAGCLHAIG
jgi:hypothetical protein